MAYSDEVLADSPWAYWRFEETSGTTAQDETANNRDGTIAGDVVLNQTGKVGQAFSFNGTAADGRVSSGVNFTATTAWTGECWVKFAAAPAAAANIIGTAAYPTGSHDRELFINTDRTVQGQVWDGAATRTTSAGAALAVDTWHHVVIREDGTNLEVWVNGASYGTVACTTATDSVPVQVAADSHVRAAFTGQVDEVAWYTTSLSNTRITAHYDAASSGGGASGGGGSVARPGRHRGRWPARMPDWF